MDVTAASPRVDVVTMCMKGYEVLVFENFVVVGVAREKICMRGRNVFRPLHVLGDAQGKTLTTGFLSM